MKSEVFKLKWKFYTDAFQRVRSLFKQLLLKCSQFNDSHHLLNFSTDGNLLWGYRTTEVKGNLEDVTNSTL